MSKCWSELELICISLFSKGKCGISFSRNTWNSMWISKRFNYSHSYTTLVVRIIFMKINVPLLTIFCTLKHCLNSKLWHLPHLGLGSTEFIDNNSYKREKYFILQFII